jgi:hypothetical protein
MKSTTKALVLDTVEIPFFLLDGIITQGLDPIKRKKRRN